MLLATVGGLCSSAAQSLLSCLPCYTQLTICPTFMKLLLLLSLFQLIILLFVCFSREFNYSPMVLKLYYSGVQNILCIGKSTGRL